MSVEAIHKIILYPFIKESISALTDMSGHHGKAGEIFEDSVDDFRFKGYAVCSEIHGDLEGVILMHHYEETASEIGAEVYKGLVGTESKDKSIVNEDISNALAEWGNTIVGRSTNFLAEHNLGFSFSAPEMVVNLDDMEKYLKDVVTIITVPVHIEDVGRYFFNLLVRKVNLESVIKSKTESTQEATLDVKPLATPLAKDAKILLVDDSPLIRKAVSRYLNELSYNNIIEAGDGNEAVEMIAAESPAIVFMDIVMNQMNGDEALAKIRETDKETPIVMLTSVSDKKIIQKCESFGIQGAVLKPLTNQTAPYILSRCLGLK